MPDPLPSQTHKKKENHYLHALCTYPDVRFESQHEGEEVILLVRAHPITFIPWISAAIIMFIIPIFSNVFLVSLMGVKEILFINLLWYCLLFSYVFMNVLYWLFNVGLITNIRVIDVDYSLIVHKEVTEAVLEGIPDATARTAGFLGTLFSYGDVHVQTQGMNQNIEFLTVPEPDTVGSTINKLIAGT